MNAAPNRLWLPVTQPLDLDATLESGQVFRWRRHGDGWSGFLGGDLVVLQSVEGGLEVRCSPASSGSVLDPVSRFLRLDDDLPQIHRRLAADPRLRGALERHAGLRLLRQDPWECLVAFICSTHSNIPRIMRVQEALAAAIGTPVRMDGLTRSRFPDAAALAEAGEARLRELGLGYRAAYVSRTAEVVASGGLDLLALRETPAAEARAALLGLHGVGDKVADCVLLFSMEKLESFPIDRWVRRAVEEWYLGGERRPYPALRAWASETFGELAGYAQQYLFYDRRPGGRGGPPGR